MTAPMGADDLTLEEVRRLAAEIGMTRLDEGQLRELLRATRLARARGAVLSRVALVPEDEPAHVYRPEPGAR